MDLNIVVIFPKINVYYFLYMEFVILKFIVH